MFSPHKGTCIECNQEKYIAVSKGYCQQCNKKLKDAKKAERLEARGEVSQTDKDEIWYRAAWRKKPHRCEECNQTLHAYNRMFISHILSKGAYTAFRNDFRNYNKLCQDCHQQWEFGDQTTMKIYKPNQIIIIILKNEYYAR